MDKPPPLSITANKDEIFMIGEAAELCGLSLEIIIEVAERVGLTAEYLLRNHLAILKKRAEPTKVTCVASIDYFRARKKGGYV